MPAVVVAPARSVLQIGFSPCPNDTFMLRALVEGDVTVPGISFEPFIADIEELNARALDPATALPITKLSLPALARTCDRYRVLAAGAALGRGVGPLVVRAQARIDVQSLADLDELLVAIPGRNTTAALLLQRFGPAAAQALPMRFSRVLDAVASGEVDAGVIIHESRFTYARHGLVAIADLGSLWERATGLPLPLGVFAVDRALGDERARAIEAAVRASVAAAFADPERTRPFVRRHAQELSDDVCDAHVQLYVNAFSLDLGSDGRAAIDALLDVTRSAGLVPVGATAW